MSEKPTYNPTIWKNEGEGGDVPDLSAENLNNIEQGIYKIYEYAINQLINSDDFIAKLSDRIVNSGSISVPGYAADARQLNPSQEGSLAQTVTQLKNDLSGKVSSLQPISMKLMDDGGQRKLIITSSDNQKWYADIIVDSIGSDSPPEV